MSKIWLDNVAATFRSACARLKAASTIITLSSYFVDTTLARLHIVVTVPSSVERLQLNSPGWGTPRGQSPRPFRTKPECVRKQKGSENVIERSPIGRPSTKLPCSLCRANRGGMNQGRPYSEAELVFGTSLMNMHTGFCQPFPQPRHPTPEVKEIRDSRLGHPTHIFAEKQSHQVIENTELRSRIGQNKPNFGHVGEGGSKVKFVT